MHREEVNNNKKNLSIHFSYKYNKKGKETHYSFCWALIKSSTQWMII